MKVDVLLGLQWGDEGKGKIVDVLTPRYDVIARFQGGPNAGHTIEWDGHKVVLHTIPSGVLNPKAINLIGSGVIIDAQILKKEIEKLASFGMEVKSRLRIARKAHLILPTHRLLDATLEKSRGEAKIGSTLKGIGPTYTDKIARQGIRMGDVIQPDFLKRYENAKNAHIRTISAMGESTASFLLDGISFEEYEKQWLDALKFLSDIEQVDSEYFIHQQLSEGKRVLAEGAQGTLLDVDFGSYPFVTSSNTVTAGVCTGLGIAPSLVGNVFGIVKAYCTRVGSGPFPTELFNETGDTLRKNGNEFGSTTGRPRRCGWLDLAALKYSVMINGVTHIFLTKPDVLSGFDQIAVATSYQRDGASLTELPYDHENLTPVLEWRKGWSEDLTKLLDVDQFPVEFKEYIKFIEDFTSVPVSIVSVGPDREQTIFRDFE